MGDNAADTTPAQCSSLRKGGYVMLKGNPCKIIDMSTSKTGKHGHAKVNMAGVDIFTGKKYEDMSPSTHNMMVPVVKREDWQLMSIDDGFLFLMNDNGDTREDIGEDQVDAEVLDEINKKLEAEEDMQVTILKAVGKEKVVAVKAYNTQ